MTYVDAFLAAVPEANKATYIAHSKAFTDVAFEYGALSVVECWEDDVPDGELTSMPLAVQRKEGEKIVVSWVTWPDKAAREAGMAKLMADPRMQPDENPTPFDGKRLIYGGFHVIVDMKA